MNKKELGKIGEELAIKYLKNLNYKILTKNYRTKNGEIDIICEKENSLIFVEVRTILKIDFIDPLETLTKRKIDKIKNCSFEYMSKMTKKYSFIKYEFIGITYRSSNDYEINHIKDIIF